MPKVIDLHKRLSTTEIMFQIAIIIGLVIGSILLMSFIGLALASLYTHQSFLTFGDTNYAYASHRTINGFKIVQVFGELGFFVLPALLLPRILFMMRPIAFNRLNYHAPLFLFFIALLCYYSFVPFLDLTINWNEHLKLPESMKGIQDWMQRSEDQNTALMKRFLEMPTFLDFAINVLIVSVLTAFAEEIFFRGFLQRALYFWTRNRHVAIIFTSFIFSFIHFEFFGFVPRFLLGMLLGYLFMWSSDLKVPMFVHFLNNFTTLLIVYLYPSKVNNPDVTTTGQYPVYAYAFSLISGVFLLFSFYRASKNRRQVAAKEEMSEIGTGNWVKIYATNKNYEADILSGSLESEGIRAVIINKRDSSYHVFGEVEVYVRQEDADRARQLISKSEA